MTWLVRLSRDWSKSQIRAEIVRNQTTKGPETLVTMPLNDFLDALAAVAGAPAGRFTRYGLKKQLHAAAAEVIKGMKQETVKIPIVVTE